MRYFLDTEFLEDGRTIELISIGIVADDGREYYAVNEEAPWNRIASEPWLRDNVLPTLPLDCIEYVPSKFRIDIRQSHEWRLREEIASEVIAFVDESPEFWGYYADYDWVVFCWLFGRMIDLPKGFPMYCRDIKQLCDQLGNPDLPKQSSNEHHALADARWNKRAFEFLQDNPQQLTLTGTD